MRSPHTSSALGAPLVASAWAVGGWLLWRRISLGIAAGPGLLLGALLPMLGLLPVLVEQAAARGQGLPVADLAVISAMALLCALPLAGFLREMR